MQQGHNTGIWHLISCHSGRSLAFRLFGFSVSDVPRRAVRPSCAELYGREWIRTVRDPNEPLSFDLPVVENTASDLARTLDVRSPFA
jgi:hypothetical protein